ncbi:MAG: hypothetical protein COU69_03660 [Candidatus Pacebacteria bacterium CG10_big_fil_rev_8_21_14_0_10_56_10]|nr:MAG: hypothetical protein COU69_03660 [Candidatus Pacebacteria bacterium CG10_big_fil_rev_8_21_14_0_10_56_10]
MTLPALQTKAGQLALVDLSHPSLVADQLGLDLSQPSGLSIAENVYKELVSVLGKSASALWLDPEHGLPVFLHRRPQTGLILSLNRFQPDDDPTGTPSLIEGWGVEQASHNYAAAALTLPYHPDEQEALYKKQFVAEIADFCRHQGIVLVLKLMVYTPADQEYDQAAFQTAQLEAIQELRAADLVFALQYPRTPLACATVTAELDEPWVLADDMEYSAYKTALREALENGAGGFLAGQMLWQDIYQLRTKDASPDLLAITRHIQTEVHDRGSELARISDEYAAEPIS